jgi:CO/xanthine dehydrogenase FAD-binding subunit
VKPAPFTYHAPATLDEALEALSRPGARALAGGQSLMPMLNFRLASPEHLVDLNNVHELSYINELTPNVVAIGAMTRQRDIEVSDLVARRLPLVAEAIRLVGHRQTRNRGTLGGSLAHLDPSAELPAVAMALDAEVVIRNSTKERRIGIGDLGRGLLTTQLEPGELITEVRFPCWPDGHGHAFEEFARRHGDFAIVSAAALVHGERVSITLGGIAPAPLRMSAAEKLFAQKRDAQAAAELCGAVDALDDHAYPAWYRKKLAVTLARRALERASAR